jgi:hypothetical protein
MWLFLSFGLAITVACLLKNVPCNSNRLAQGLFMGCISAVLFLYTNFLIIHIIAFLIAFLALFAIIQDVVFLLRALILKTSNIKASNVNRKVEPKDGWFVVITTILALILAIIPIIQGL